MKSALKLLAFITVFLSLPIYINAQNNINYELQSDRSDLRVLAYRDGVFSTFAHNHVIKAEKITGTLDFNKENYRLSKFVLKIPVEFLLVDDPENRIEEGKDFITAISPEDRFDIKKVMLSDTLLDFEAFPFIYIHSSKAEGSLDATNLIVYLTLHGVQKKHSLKVKISKEGRFVRVIGKTKIKQSHYNMDPISLFLGSIKVKNTMDVKFNLLFKATNK